MELTTPEPIWQKRVGNFTLVEYLLPFYRLGCHIICKDEDTELRFSFNSWGMERDAIVVEDCLTFCQRMLHDKITCFNCSFASALEYALSEARSEDWGIVKQKVHEKILEEVLKISLEKSL